MFNKKKKNKDERKEDDISSVKIEDLNSNNSNVENEIKTEEKIEKKNKKKMPDNANIAVYQWLKVVQAIILVVLGIIFIITSFYNGTQNEDSDNTSNVIVISGYIVGAVFAVYGVINILAGYLLLRGPFAHEVPTGVLALCFAVVFFCKPELFEELLPYVIMTALCAYFTILFIYALDLLLWKEKENKFLAGVFFTTSIIILAIAITYIIMWNIPSLKKNIQKCITIVVGAILIVLGILSLVNTIKKVSNTNAIIKEQEELKTYETEQAKKSRLKIFRKPRENKKHVEEIEYKSKEDDSSTQYIANSDNSDNNNNE